MLKGAWKELNSFLNNTEFIYMSRNCMKIGNGSDLGIKGLRDFGIE
jgi:hypothetical protein